VLQLHGVIGVSKAFGKATEGQITSNPFYFGGRISNPKHHIDFTPVTALRDGCLQQGAR